MEQKNYVGSAIFYSKIEYVFETLAEAEPKTAKISVYTMHCITIMVLALE